LEHGYLEEPTIPGLQINFSNTPHSRLKPDIIPFKDYLSLFVSLYHVFLKVKRGRSLPTV
jgi:hypothetical protein